MGPYFLRGPCVAGLGRNAPTVVVAILAVLLTGCLQPLSSDAAGTAGEDVIVLQPGDDLQAAIDANPPGATFLLQPGVYREQRLKPKDRQSFIGEGEVILSGARVLTGWRQDGRYWFLPDLPPALPVKFEKLVRYGPPEALAREMLFLDGQLYQPVSELSKLRPGAWYRDGDRAVVVDDPSGRLTELAVVEDAIYGSAEGLLLRNIVIEKYASGTHRGTIEGRKGRGWRLEGVTARLNHSIALRTGEDFVVDGGRYVDNGQQGISVPRDNLVVRNAEICGNNTLGFFKNWEAGGIKVFADSVGIVIEGNSVCNNRGNGIWTDGSTRNPQIIDNRVYGNDRHGIFLELTYGGLVAGNHVYDNARVGRHHELRGAQILLTQTSDAEVRDNLVVVPPDNGHGITLLHYKRGPWITTNNRIHHNQIVHLAERGLSGSYARNDDTNLRDNQFDYNTYIVPEGSFDEYWWFDGSQRGQAYLGKLGFEQNGRVMRVAEPSSYIRSPAAQ